jgi:hypothetical protein
MHSVIFRGTMLFHTIQFNKDGKLELPGIIDGKPSEAVVRAFARVPMKVMAPNVEYEVPPFDMDELIQLIEKEKGTCGPLG